MSGAPGRMRPATLVALLVAAALIGLLASAPALMARDRAENAMPRVQQAVTDTTVEGWIERRTEHGASERESRAAEREVFAELADAGIDTVVLGMPRPGHYDPERLRRLAARDVRVVLAVATFPAERSDRVRAEVERAVALTGATRLLPQATESHPSLPSNAAWMRDHGLVLTDIAGGAAIPGVEAVARPGHTVRAHEIPVGEEPSAGLESRALRAVKERGVRMLIYRYAERQRVAPLERTTTVASAVAGRLPGGMRPGVASTLDAPRPAWSVPFWIGLPVGLAGATVAASLVVARGRAGAVPRLVGALGVAVVTGLVVAASGAGWPAMVGIRPFDGVKVLLLGPPLLLAAWACWQHRRALLAAATPRRVVLAVGIVAAVLAVYLLRSGNSGIAFTPELWLRDRLDDLLYVRPRFKEVLLGVPALTVAALCGGYAARCRGWVADLAARVLAAVGAIGTASIADTFAHFHTPIRVGLLRTGYAAVAGIALGLLAWWALRRWRRNAACG